MNTEELEKKFGDAQEELLRRFKLKMQDVCDATISSMYTDVANYATTDAHTNYHNFLRDELRAEFIKEITEENSYHSWGHSIRLEILKKYPDKIQNKIISDLQDRVKSLENHLREMRKY